MKPEAPPIAESFSGSLLAWFEQHGRRDLPWQLEPTPYKVWVSEIMLQQTQVATVIGYYQRFTGAFPDVQSLAASDLDEVLHLWSGLGYYARARNLHRAAGIIQARFGGIFPRELDELRALPGIGRTTAAAILALAHGDRHAILDGNVKRVLCRYHAVEGWSGNSNIARRLWDYAEQHVPGERVAEYTQAIMDLGATVCTRTQPACGECPLAHGCLARRAARAEDFPTPRPRKPLPLRRRKFLIIRDPQGNVLLERRPPTGIWGGLWSFPEAEPDADLDQWCLAHLGRAPATLMRLPCLRHVFTHFQLAATPVLVEIERAPRMLMEGDQTLWYNTAAPPKCGVAAPVARLLAELPDALDRETDL